MAFLWDGDMYSSVSDIQETIGNELLGRTKISENDYVLDAGCGAGNITFKIAKMVKNGLVTGIDSSDSMIKKCNETIFIEKIQNVEFQVADITEITYINRYDIVFSNSVFHWIRDSRKALELLFRALKSTGSISIQFPLLNNNHPLVHFANQVIAELGIEAFYVDWRFPWYVPIKQDFESIMLDTGFRNVVLKEVSKTFKFESANQIYAFFDSVGLQLYLDSLKKDEAELFRTTLLKLINESKHELAFERLFAFAHK